MYFMGKFNSSWYRIPRGKYMDGLSGLFRSPERRVNANLNTSLVRVIYITTILELCPSMNRECGNLTNAPETQSSSSAACYSPCPSISKLHTPTAEMLLTRGNADQVQSEYPIRSQRLPAARVRELLLSTSPESSSQPLHGHEVVFLKGSQGGSRSSREPPRPCLLQEAVLHQV